MRLGQNERGNGRNLTLDGCVYPEAPPASLLRRWHLLSKCMSLHNWVHAVEERREPQRPVFTLRLSMNEMEG